MLYVAVLAIVVFVACFTVVAVALWKTFGRVKSLGRTVAAASERIAEVSAELEKIAPASRE